MGAVLSTISQAAERALGLHTPAADLGFWEMSLRALVAFAWGVILFRIGDRRLLGRNSGFDVLLVVLLGSVLSRGVNGQANFAGTLGVSGVLVFFHHVLSVAASRSDAFSRLVKGMPRILVQHGRADAAEMQGCRITVDDLEENLRINGNVAHASDVEEARLERNGNVSVVRKPEAKGLS